jgi:hypothetical protein
LLAVRANDALGRMLGEERPICRENVDGLRAGVVVNDVAGIKAT